MRPNPWQSEFWKAVLEAFFFRPSTFKVSGPHSAVILAATTAAPGAVTQSNPWVQCLHMEWSISSRFRVLKSPHDKGIDTKEIGQYYRPVLVFWLGFGVSLPAGLPNVPLTPLPSLHTVREFGLRVALCLHSSGQVAV